MAFPANQIRLAPALDQVAGIMKGVRAFALDRRAAMAAGNVAANSIIDLWERLKTSKAQLQSLASTPGLADYAQDQYGNESLNISTEFTAVINAIDGVTGNIESTFPKDASNWLLAASFGASALTYRQFTPAQTSTLQGLLQTLADTIS